MNETPCPKCGDPIDTDGKRDRVRLTCKTCRARPYLLHMANEDTDGCFPECTSRHHWQMQMRIPAGKGCEVPDDA